MSEDTAGVSNGISPQRQSFKSISKSLKNTSLSKRSNSISKGVNKISKNTAKNTPKRTPNKSTSNKSTSKRTPNKSVYQEQIDRFKIYLEQSFAENDKKYPDYQITTRMLANYLNANLFGNNSNPDLWVQILKKNRHLLYLDQFLSFVNIINTNNSYKQVNINQLYAPQTYFSLPIMQKIARQTAIPTSNKSESNTEQQSVLLQEYTDTIYNRMLDNHTQMSETSSKNINNISFICSHGGIADKAVFIKVPNDIVIAFITPINNYGYSSSVDNSFKTIYEMQNNQNSQEKDMFFANPACFFRNTGCLNNAVYYYPGQYIPNFHFSIIPNENTKTGVYINLKTPQIIEPIFNFNEQKKYTLDISNIFTTHYETFKGQILYIFCCRKCDLTINKQGVELIYRYENIVTHLNISYCLSLAYSNSSNVNKYKCLFKKTGNYIRNIASNEENPSLFYDSATLIKFKSDKLPRFPKSRYMIDSLSASNITTFINDPYNTNDNILNTFLEQLNYLLDDLKIKFSTSKIEKIKTLLDNYYFPEHTFLHIIKQSDFINKLINICNSNSYMFLNVLFPLFKIYKFILIFSLIETYLVDTYNIYDFINKIVNHYELTGKLNLENINEIFKHMISLNKLLDTTQSNDILQNIVSNRTSILVGIYKNNKTRTFIKKISKTVSAPFISKLLTLYYTQDISFDYSIFSISPLTLSELKQDIQLNNNTNALVFNPSYYSNNTDLPDIITNDAKLDKSINERKEIIYYAIIKQNTMFFSTLIDLYTIDNQMAEKRLLFNLLYILILYRKTLLKINLLYQLSDYLNLVIVSKLSYSVFNNNIFLFFYKIIDTHSTNRAILNEYYNGNKEILSACINPNIFTTLSINTDINIDNTYEKLIINFLTKYTEILRQKGKQIDKFLKFPECQILLN